MTTRFLQILLALSAALTAPADADDIGLPTIYVILNHGPSMHSWSPDDFTLYATKEDCEVALKQQEADPERLALRHGQCMAYVIKGWRCKRSVCRSDYN
jgi:hypothetical protein